MCTPPGTMYIYSDITYTQMIDVSTQVSHLLLAWWDLRYPQMGNQPQVGGQPLMRESFAPSGKFLFPHKGFIILSI